MPRASTINVLDGRLNSEVYHPPFLITYSFLKKMSSDAITCLINDSLMALWPNFDSNKEAKAIEESKKLPSSPTTLPSLRSKACS